MYLQIFLSSNIASTKIALALVQNFGNGERREVGMCEHKVLTYY